MRALGILSRWVVLELEPTLDPALSADLSQTDFKGQTCDDPSENRGRCLPNLICYLRNVPDIDRSDIRNRVLDRPLWILNLYRRKIRRRNPKAQQTPRRSRIKAFITDVCESNGSIDGRTTAGCDEQS